MYGFRPEEHLARAEVLDRVVADTRRAIHVTGAPDIQEHITDLAMSTLLLADAERAMARDDGDRAAELLDLVGEHNKRTASRDLAAMIERHLGPPPQ